MERICRHCKQDISDVPPTEAITRHIVGLCAPSHNEVDAVLEDFERMNIREIEAIRRQFQREKSPPIQVNNRTAVKILIFLAVVGGALSFALSYFQAP